MKKSNKIFLALFAIYLVLVAYCCFWNFDSLPAVDRTMFGIPTDKLVHFLMFFPFPILCDLAFERGWKTPWQIRLAVLAVAAMGLGPRSGSHSPAIGAATRRISGQTPSR